MPMELSLTDVHVWRWDRRCQVWGGHHRQHLELAWHSWEQDEGGGNSHRVEMLFGC